MRSGLSLLLAVSVLAGPRGALAEPDLPRPVVVGAAVIPGLVLHGSGHMAAGDQTTALRLFAAEGLGLALLTVGFGTLLLTGASRHLVAPVFALPVAGSGLVITSWLADLYGVTAPAGGWGHAWLRTPAWEARLGTRYVYDPTLTYGTLLGPAVDLRWRRWRLSPEAWLSRDNQRFSLQTALRPWGPNPAGAAVDGSFTEFAAGVAHHRYQPERFTLSTLEGQLQGRVDLRRLAPSLQGSFVDWGLGLAVVLTHYLTGSEETDAEGLLLARFGFGVWLGRGGELGAYYDHRHDDYAGGLKLGGLGSGAAGHFGLQSTVFFSDVFGVRAELQAGSSYLAGLALVWRGGAP